MIARIEIIIRSIPGWVILTVEDIRTHKAYLIFLFGRGRNGKPSRSGILRAPRGCVVESLESLARCRAVSGGRLLIAEGDPAFRATIGALLRADGHQVVEVANGFDLLSTLEASVEAPPPAGQFDLVICDARLSGLGGLRMLTHLGRGRTVPPVVFTAPGGDEALREEAIRLGALAVLDKPIDVDGMLTLVRCLIPHGIA